MRFEKAAIVEALNALSRKDPKCELFGSNRHQYRLNPPLSKQVVNAFEKKHAISFPEEYKYFITVVGNGGAGPYYGLFRFGEQDDLRDFCKWEDGSLVGDLTKDFPHTQAWNLPQSFWDKAPNPGPETRLEEEDRMNEEWDSQLDEKYWNPKIMNGAMPICHLGCALRQWLVINGEQKGFIWGDDRVDSKGIYPLRDSRGGQVTFEAWYMSWLRDPKKAMSKH